MKPPEMYVWTEALKSGEFRDGHNQRQLRRSLDGELVYNAFGVLTAIFPFRSYRTKRTNTWDTDSLKCPPAAAMWLCGAEWREILLTRHAVIDQRQTERWRRPYYFNTVAQLIQNNMSFEEIAATLEEHGIRTTAPTQPTSPF